MRRIINKVRKFKIKVEGKVYDVEVEEVVEDKSVGGTVSTSPPLVIKTTEELEKPKTVTISDSSSISETKTTEVTGEEVVAPMPGKVLKLKVSEGDSVKEGDTLLILEAMKMENEIVANVSGKVKKINAALNDMVDAGDVLIVIG
jgi:biotin carboxyl carrier protein